MAFDLCPISSMLSAGGPMKLMECARQTRAKAAFSERKPMPGCRASAPFRSATRTMLMAFK